MTAHELATTPGQDSDVRVRQDRTAAPDLALLSAALRIALGPSGPRAEIARSALFQCAEAAPGLSLAVVLGDGDSADREALVHDGLEVSPGGARVFPGAAAEVIGRAERGAAVVHVASRSGQGLPSPATVDLLATTLARRVAASNEVDEPASLRRRLIHSERLASLGRVLAGLVHELATPLGAIGATADALGRSAAARGADATEMARIELLSEAATRIERLCRDVVAYARPTTEQPSKVSLPRVMLQAAAFAEHELAAANAVFSVDLAPDLPDLVGIERQLVQVMVNLLSNAAHALAGRGGQVTLAAVREGDRVFVTVSDTGVGMGEEDAERVFEPFYTTKPAGRGTGLGLAIVRDILDSHGARITVETVLGKGTTFRIAFAVER